MDPIVYLGQTWISDSSDSFNAHVAEVKELTRLGIELDQVRAHHMFSRIPNLFSTIFKSKDCKVNSYFGNFSILKQIEENS